MFPNRVPGFVKLKHLKFWNLGTVGTWELSPCDNGGEPPEIWDPQLDPFALLELLQQLAMIHPETKRLPLVASSFPLLFLGFDVFLHVKDVQITFQFEPTMSKPEKQRLKQSFGIWSA